MDDHVLCYINSYSNTRPPGKAGHATIHPPKEKLFAHSHSVVHTVVLRGLLKTCVHCRAVAITKRRKSAKQFCSFAGANSYLRTLKIRYADSSGEEDSEDEGDNPVSIVLLLKYSQFKGLPSFSYCFYSSIPLYLTLSTLFSSEILKLLPSTPSN